LDAEHDKLVLNSWKCGRVREKNCKRCKKILFYS